MEVSALKNQSDIDNIKEYLKSRENQRNYVLFVTGISVGLRASDLLKLQVQDVYSNGKCIDKIALTEKKTSKKRKIKINPAVQELLNNYYQELPSHSPEQYLFYSEKELIQGDNVPIETRSLNRLVKTWCDYCGIKGNYGSHTLRKTFGYWTYIKNQENPRCLLILQQMFNHSSSNITLRYIGIDEDEIDAMYNSLIL